MEKNSFDHSTREDILRAMLHRENDLRRAPETQAAMERAEGSARSEWMDVVEDIQKQVVQEFQNKSLHKITIQDLRSAAMRYPDIAHWVKYNRARRGTLKVGDAAPDVPLRCARTCDPTTLLTYKIEHDSGSRDLKGGQKKPIVVFAGSLS